MDSADRVYIIGYRIFVPISKMALKISHQNQGFSKKFRVTDAGNYSALGRN